MLRVVFTPPPTCQFTTHVAWTQVVSDVVGTLASMLCKCSQLGSGLNPKPSCGCGWFRVSIVVVSYPCPCTMLCRCGCDLFC
jgi:hypothetical protein